ncbi:hypothetical protein D3C86_1776960 [compost metagenome]
MCGTIAFGGRESIHGHARMRQVAEKRCALLMYGIFSGEKTAGIGFVKRIRSRYKRRSERIH